MKVTHLFAGVLMASAAAAAAHATTVDFTTYATDTALASVGDLSFSTNGGPGADGTPLIGMMQFPPGGLTNSTTPETSTFNNYPTDEFLNFSFATSASDISFVFNNQGNNGTTSYTAYSGATAIDSGDLSNVEGSSVNVSGSDITKIVFDNGTGGTSNWVFNVASITYTSAAPEPASWALMLVGVGMAGAGLRMARRKGGMAIAAA